MLADVHIFYIPVTVHRNTVLLNNQPDTPIIHIYSVIKLYMFRASLCPSSGMFYCTFGTGKFHAGFWWPLASRVRMELSSFPSWLCLEAAIKNLHETYQCRIYSRNLLMISREDARNM